MITRRRMFGVGAAAAASIPAARQFSWQSQDFKRPDVHPEGPAPAGEWRNWSGLHRAKPRQLAVPADEAELAELLVASEGPVRPVGSGHSFTALVPTPGTLVDLSRLAGLRSHDAEDRRVVLGAGTRIRQAALQLAEVGLGFANQPDIDIQTLAGCFSTATHGTGRTLAALHDSIRRFRMVTANGDVLDVTRDSDPELFSAGQVSLGALGLITEYELEVEPIKNLRRRMWVEPTEALLGRAEALAEQHRNFEMFLLPHLGLGVGLSHDVVEDDPTGRPASEDEDALADLRTLRDVLGGWPWLRRKVAGLGLPSGTLEEGVAESWRMLSTARRTRFQEMEYHLPSDVGLEGVRDTLRTLERRPEVWFPMEVRWIAGDEAWLSPFNGGGRVSVATHTGVDEPFDYFFSELEPRHLERGGRPHWGKLHSLDAEALRARYPRLEDFVRVRARLDPSGRFLNPHLCRVLGVEAARV